MRLELKKYLYDIQKAANLIGEFTDGKEFGDHIQNAMLRAAVEREFEIIGEAMSKLAKLDGGLTSRITGYRQVIDFRNVLIHGYAEVDDLLVWDIVESRLPTLSREVALLLSES